MKPTVSGFYLLDTVTKEYKGPLTDREMNYYVQTNDLLSLQKQMKMVAMERASGEFHIPLANTHQLSKNGQSFCYIHVNGGNNPMAKWPWPTPKQAAASGAAVRKLLSNDACKVALYGTPSKTEDDKVAVVELKDKKEYTKTIEDQKPMTDLEKAEICAKIMGLDYELVSHNTPDHTIRCLERVSYVGVEFANLRNRVSYWPLTNKKQCFELIEKNKYAQAAVGTWYRDCSDKPWVSINSYVIDAVVKGYLYG